MSEETSKRFARLESHIAHLEAQVEVLNEVVIDQGKTLDLVRKQVRLQARALETAEIERTKAINPKPPHH